MLNVHFWLLTFLKTELKAHLLVLCLIEAVFILSILIKNVKGLQKMLLPI